MRELCVAHLVRKGNDMEATRSFLDSYIRHPAGIAHDLLVVFKGFASPRECNEYDEMLDGIAHKRAYVRDFGFDIGAYRRVAAEHAYRYLVFLNSFSLIRQPGWLEIMYRHARQDGIGVVGATGSYQSLLTDFVMMRQRAGDARVPHWHQTRRTLRYLMSVRTRFPVFPNPHVRTNAFLIAAEVFRRIRCPSVFSKWGAYRLESGTHGLTQQILDAGLKPVLVGRDGHAYEVPDWLASRTFWIAEQQNVLVDDKQTISYLSGPPERQELFSYTAWHCWPDGSPRSVPPANLR